MNTQRVFRVASTDPYGRPVLVSRRSPALVRWELLGLAAIMVMAIGVQLVGTPIGQWRLEQYLPLAGFPLLYGLLSFGLRRLLQVRLTSTGITLPRMREIPWADVKEVGVWRANPYAARRTMTRLAFVLTGMERQAHGLQPAVPAPAGNPARAPEGLAPWNFVCIHDFGATWVEKMAAEVNEYRTSLGTFSQVAPPLDNR